VTGAYDLYKNLDPTKLIKGTMKVRVLSLYFSLGATDYSFFAVGSPLSQLAKAGMDHARRGRARGPADNIGFFLTLSATVSIIEHPEYKMQSIMETYARVLFPTKMSGRNGSVQPVDARWEYAGQ